MARKLAAQIHRPTKRILRLSNLYTDKAGPVVVIGAGPAGLIAAEILSAASFSVIVIERKPSVGRKFLMAGRGGLNLTHSEDLEKFIPRYGGAQNRLAGIIHDFPPTALCEWCQGLGQETFVGSSGRIFPVAMKASPLLRAWMARLRDAGVEFRLNTRWQGWDDNNNLLLKGADGKQQNIKPAATLLALGGGSWPGLGSDGGWVELLKDKNVPVAPLRPANCGFHVTWSEIMKTQHAGQPLKSIAVRAGQQSVAGEAMISAHGLEGGAIYALSATIRDAIERDGQCTVEIDLKPGLTMNALEKKLAAPRGRQSFSTWLAKQSGLSSAAIGLLREIRRDVQLMNTQDLSALIKAVPVRMHAPFSIERAISSAGGITMQALDDDLMIRTLPGVFAAGEMLDWEAPTGGYLLQASFATGVRAARGIQNYLNTTD
jgi:uncharacterized flavoprotein (TIGR03862 family)